MFHADKFESVMSESRLAAAVGRATVSATTLTQMAVDLPS